MVFWTSSTSFSTPSTSFFTLILVEVSLAGQSIPVTLEQKSKRKSAASRRKVATARECSTWSKSECCSHGLGLGIISTRQPGTFASMADLMFSRFIRPCLRNLDQRRPPHCRILGWLQIVRSELRNNKLARLAGVQVARPGFAGQGLFIDLFLEHEEGVNQGFRPGR